MRPLFNPKARLAHDQIDALETELSKVDENIKRETEFNKRLCEYSHGADIISNIRKIHYCRKKCRNSMFLNQILVCRINI